MKIKRIETAHDGVGDIRSVETMINDKRAQILSVHYTGYLSE